MNGILSDDMRNDVKPASVRTVGFVDSGAGGVAGGGAAGAAAELEIVNPSNVCSTVPLAGAGVVDGAADELCSKAVRFTYFLNILSSSSADASD